MLVQLEKDEWLSIVNGMVITAKEEDTYPSSVGKEGTKDEDGNEQLEKFGVVTLTVLQGQRDFRKFYQLSNGAESDNYWHFLQDMRTLRENVLIPLDGYSEKD